MQRYTIFFITKKPPETCRASTVIQNRCNIVYPRNIVCFRYTIVSILHNGDNKDNNNNNNNNIFKDKSELKMQYSVHHLRISFAVNSHSK